MPRILTDEELTYWSQPMWQTPWYNDDMQAALYTARAYKALAERLQYEIDSADHDVGCGYNDNPIYECRCFKDRALALTPEQALEEQNKALAEKEAG